jgi:hypothetical protein
MVNPIKLMTFLMAWFMLLHLQNMKKEVKAMDTISSAKKGLYIGSGVGLVLFTLVGLLPGSFIGGVAGLSIAGMLFGLPLDNALMPRIIVGISMVLGVMVSAIIFTAGAGLIGWMVGHMLDVVKTKKVADATLHAKS